jgi:hypothetical protein
MELKEINADDFIWNSMSKEELMEELTAYHDTPPAKEILRRLEAGEKAIEKLAEVHDWYCGCGHWNGANLSFCAACRREPNES